MWDLLKGMSLSDRKVFFSQMEGEKSKVTVLEDRRTKFQDLLNQWGYKSPTDFLIECEFITNPSVKKSRVKITKEVRKNIISDLRKEVPTKEISTKYGVTEDAIYNIKGKSGLTKPKTKKVPTPTVTVPTPTVTVNPTTVPSPIVSVSVSESVSPSNVTPMVQSPELKKEVV